MFTAEYIQDLCNDAVVKAEEYIKSSDWFNAEALLKQVLLVDPELLQAKKQLAFVLTSQNKNDEATVLYDQILADSPKDYTLMNDAALGYSQSGDYDTAKNLLTECIEMSPDEPLAYNNLAVQYMECDQIEKADKTFSAGLERIPESAYLWYSYGAFLNEQAEFEKAITCYQLALKYKPNMPNAHYNLALAYLTEGQYAKGFSEFEYRYQCNKSFLESSNRFAKEGKKPWRGECIKGRKLLVFNEQGVGDAFQFCRFFPALKELGAEVIVETPVDVIDLFSTAKGIDRLLPYGTVNDEDYDCYVSICSLPHFLLVTEKNVSTSAYLSATGTIPDEHFDNYKTYKKIGIAWAGNPVHPKDHLRSFSLSYFRQIHDIENVKLFSLQKDVRNRFWPKIGAVDLTEDCEDMSIVDMKDIMLNWNYTAAVVDKMDLIITADSALAHLAGAMNKPCFVLVPFVPDWRWGARGNPSWYNSVTIFRQPQKHDWHSVFNAITAKLKE